MVTTVTKTIGAGGDCADINAFDALLPANLVTADQKWIGYILPGEIVSSTQQQITAHTCDATRNITLMPQIGAGFAENANKLTNALTYNASNGSALRSTLSFAPNYIFTPDYFTVLGLQWKSDSSFAQGTVKFNGSNTTFFGNIVDSLAGDNDGVVYSQTVSTGHLCASNIIRTARAGNVLNIDFVDVNVANNTLICTQSGGNGIRAGNSGNNSICKNNAIFGITTPINANAINNSANNASNVTFSGGTGNIGSLNQANQFNGTSDFRLKSGNALALAGTTVTGFTTDILGLALTSPPAIGSTSASSVAPAATGITMSGPTSGSTGIASSNFTIGVTPVGGTITGTVTVTPSDGGDGGTFNPTSVNLTTASPTATFTYTAVSNGVKTISVTNNGSLANPSNITYTASTPADTTPPVETGTLTVSSITSNSFTLGWPAGSDNVGVTGYEYSINGGTSYIDAGNVLSTVISGLTASTTYQVRLRAYDAAGNRSTPPLATTATTTSGAGNNVIDVTKILFSPGNWNISGNTAQTVNAGAYFRLIFTGNTCTLQFDMTNMSEPSQMRYRVDGQSAWTLFTVQASVSITIPSATTSWGPKGGHLLEVDFMARGGSDSWNNPFCFAKLIGVLVDSGAAISKPYERPLKGIVFGDSITEGQVTLGSTTSGTAPDATVGYAYNLQTHLNAEIGVVGFGSQGWTVGGPISVPPFPSAYNLHYAGASRSFTGIDFVVINHGTNDGTTDVTSSVTTVLNGLLGVVTINCKIFVLRPFNGNRSANIIAGIAACNNPSRINYVDTTGFFDTTGSSDGIHPFGNENINHIAPTLATALRPLLESSDTLTVRNVSITLGDTNGASANLTGLKVSFYDEPSPDLHTVPRYQSATQTTNGSGVMTFTVNSTLTSGGTGHLVVLSSSGQHFNGPVGVT